MPLDFSPRFPDVHVRLVGHDGNAFAILSAVSRALRKAGVSQEKVDEYWDEATSGEYDHLLRTTIQWVNVQQMGEQMPDAPPGLTYDDMLELDPPDYS